MSVLSVFSMEHPSHTLSDIAREAGIPMSTAHRLLESLVELDILARTEQKRYVIGSRIAELGVLAPRTYQQRTHVVPHLERLFLATRHQVVLSVLAGDGATLTIQQLLGWRDTRRSAGLGDTLPLHASSPGHVALVYGPPRVFEGLSTRPLARFTAATITGHDDLRRTLRDVKRAGVAVARGHLVADTASMSVPVFGYRGGFYGALSLVWNLDAVEPPGLQAELLRTAQGISAALRDAPLKAPARSIV